MNGKNYVHVYDGRNATDALLGTFSGLKQRFTIQSSGRYMLIYLAKEGKVQQSTCNFKGVFTFIATMGELLFLTHGSLADSMRSRGFLEGGGVRCISWVVMLPFVHLSTLFDQ